MRVKICKHNNIPLSCIKRRHYITSVEQMAWNRENFLVNKAVKRMNNLKSYVALPLLVLVLLGDDDGVTGRNAADPGVD